MCGEQLIQLLEDEPPLCSCKDFNFWNESAMAQGFFLLFSETHIRNHLLHIPASENSGHSPAPLSSRPTVNRSM